MATTSKMTTILLKAAWDLKKKGRTRERKGREGKESEDKIRQDWVP